MPVATQRFQVMLREVSDQRSKPDTIEFDCRESGINICPNGYGDFSSDPGTGAPIFIERHEGKLRLIVWSDINAEEPTHVISLEGAKESRRTELASSKN